MILTESGLPSVKYDTIKSIVGEVFDKKKDFGISDFESTIEDENYNLAFVLHTFIESIADSIPGYNSDQRDELSAVAKISCHLLYKSMVKQLEINSM